MRVESKVRVALDKRQSTSDDDVPVFNGKVKIIILAAFIAVIAGIVGTLIIIVNMVVNPNVIVPTTNSNPTTTPTVTTTETLTPTPTAKP